MSKKYYISRGKLPALREDQRTVRRLIAGSADEEERAVWQGLLNELEEKARGLTRPSLEGMKPRAEKEKKDEPNSVF